MSEYTILYTAVGSMLGMTIACLFYGLGGRSGKWLRRFIGSLILATTVNIATVIMGKWNPWLIAIYPALIIGFSMGYGVNDGNVLFKVIRRTLYALGVLAAGAIFFITMGPKALWILIPHAGIGLWSVYLGTKNPMHAAAEEVFVCALLNIGLCMYPFIV